MLSGASILPQQPRRLITDTMLLYLTTPLHVSVCRVDQVDQGRGIDVASGPELHVPHVLAGTFQQASWVREFSATEEADIDMGFERVDIGERCIRDTRSRVAIMEQFAYIISTGADNVEPVPRDRAQFT